MRPYKIDIPVRVNIWIRPDCQRKQFEVLKQACPSVIFLQSDGGRNEREWEAIKQNRKLFEDEVDWDCEIHKLYEEHNLGLYTMGRKVSSYIWEHVDRCIFLEDDYVPAVSFFRFCAELLEKYKDDERIEMICGNNVFETYLDAEPYDYFFSQNGWSIWGIATWRNRTNNRIFPFDYANNAYIKRCLEHNLTPFWYKKVKGYCTGRLVDNHAPGGEYFHAVNSALFHRLSILPTRNMINNIGTIGEHADHRKRTFLKAPSVFNLKVFEIDFPIKHPKYFINDIYFGERYERLLRHDIKSIRYYIRLILKTLDLILHGQLFSKIKKRFEIEK
ncbi:MAG: hypothetical protein PHZ09_02160 [Eubacteriales bacterium]|nr:hypothetical protein [Eubacteriales bacterium]